MIGWYATATQATPEHNLKMMAGFKPHSSDTIGGALHHDLPNQGRHRAFKTWHGFMSNLPLAPLLLE
jgi:hypothetical protein